MMGLKKTKRKAQIIALLLLVHLCLSNVCVGLWQFE
jgi:hypothetical protein